MKRLAATTWLVLALHAGGLSPTVRAAGAPAATGPTVMLPPMLVEESKSGVPWLYVNVGGTEFLSRCSEYTTGQFVEAWLTKMQLMRVLVPEEFLVRTDVPTVCVLYAQDLDQTVSAEIQRELQGTAERPGEPSAPSRVNLAPNMRLGDRDMHATIVYLDEDLADPSTLSIAPSHVRYLLQGRVPELPAWLVEGIERLWPTADFSLRPITLGPLVWQDQGESDALAGNRSHPRALLPAGELFADEPSRLLQNQHPRRLQTRAAQQELFIRWALTSGEATRDALWKFAARAAAHPVTEEMFEACFGFDFSELRDRLSDYLPMAVEETKRIPPGTLTDLPRFKVERATPNQIARVRGEWERLAIWHVQRRLPQAREPYIAQARRTLHRAYDAGDRDPPAARDHGPLRNRRGPSRRRARIPRARDRRRRRAAERLLRAGPAPLRRPAARRAGDETIFVCRARARHPSAPAGADAGAAAGGDFRFVGGGVDALRKFAERG